MPAINLLPTDLSPKSSIARLSNLLKRINLVGLVLLVVVAIGLIAFVVFLSFQMKGSVNRQEQLKTTIKSLQQTEEKLILTKDRLEKAKQILGKETSIGGIESLNDLFKDVSESVSLREAQISATKMELSFIARSSSGLTKILAKILATDYFETIRLTSFSFNTGVGYVVSLDLLN